MCGISGFVALAGQYEHFDEFVEYFSDVNARIAQRGPDCFGLYGMMRGGGSAIEKGNLKTRSWETIFDGFFSKVGHPKIVLANFRGIPTTEFLAGGKEEDRIQPYYDPLKQFIITHNGQLSNDDELNQKYDHRFFTDGKDIDSYYFIRVLQAGNISNIVYRLAEVDGSYAIACLSKPTNTVYFARSFRGLFFAIWKKSADQYLVWASEHEALDCGPDIAIVEMPLNSIIEFPLNKRVPSLKHLLWQAKNIKPADKAREKSCAVVLSGGMDSTVCLADVIHQYECFHLLHFRYGARAEQREVESVHELFKWFANQYPQKIFMLTYIDLDFIKKLGGSTLTDHSMQIAQGEIAIETTHEWVPARNIAMIGLATSYCDRYNVGTIVLGLNNEEGGVFEDNSIEFFERMEAALEIGSHSRPKLVMPLGRSMKAHIAKRGLELGAPLHLSWSCYEGKQERCGLCGPCAMRQRAFAMNGLRDDVVVYSERDSIAEQILERTKSNL